MLASPGTCWKFKTLGPTPDLLNASVHEPNNSDPRIVCAGIFNLRISLVFAEFRQLLQLLLFLRECVREYGCLLLRAGTLR